MIDTFILEYPIPFQARQVLRQVQNVESRAILAGGCIRDAINKRPINDIDIFVPQSTAHYAQRALAQGRKLAKVIPEPYFTFNHSVSDVRYYEAEGQLPVNLIAVADNQCSPEHQLQRFDFGICRVAFDGERLWKDLSFDRDQRDETFSLMVDQTAQQREHSLLRYARMQAKYPGWKFVDRAPSNCFDL